MIDVVGYLSYNPVVKVHLGPLAISPHGVGIAIGFIIGAQFMLPTSRRKGIPDDVVYPLFTRAAIGAIIGSRLAFVINHIGDYLNPLEILRVWQGGISLLGGIIGAILLALPAMRRQRLSFWRVMDAAMPGLALGILVGRLGDLIIADHLGKTTSFFVGYRCPPASVVVGSPCTPGTIVHQTALYDQMLAGVLLLVLLYLRRKPRFEGFITMAFGAGYGAARLLEDFLREDARRFGLTGSQWTAVTAIAVCTYGLAVLRHTPRWGRWDERPPPSPSLSNEDDDGQDDGYTEAPRPAPPPVEQDGPDPAPEGGEGQPEGGDSSGDPDRRDPVTEGDRG